MQTIKTAVVVVLLLVVLYGAYIAINGSETDLPPELQKLIATESEVDVDVSMPGFDAAGLTASNGFSSGLKPGNPFAPKSDGADIATGPNPVFGGPQATTPAVPATLPPPKLTSIPPCPGFRWPFQVA